MFSRPAWPIKLSLLLGAVSHVSGAYLHWETCPNSGAPNSTVNDSPTFSAGIVPDLTGSHQSLQLNWSFWTTTVDCAVAQGLITAGEVHLTTLWDSKFVRTEPDVACRPFAFPDGLSGAILDVPMIVDDFGPLPPLSTMHIEAHILWQSQVGEAELTCVLADATPALKQRVSAAIDAVSWATLAVVFLSAVLRTAFPDDYVPGVGPRLDPAARPLLPALGDCLQYLQFIFLTGGLSVNYPGFFQPAIARLHWFSLFSDGDISRRPAYMGIRDGVYETNGTMTGQLGMDTLAQTIGAPANMDIWLNMVIFFMIIVLISALVLQAYQVLLMRNSLGYLRACHRSLSVALMYFLLPLVSFSVYEICQSSSLILAYSLLVVVSLSVASVTIKWLTRRWVARRRDIKRLSAQSLAMAGPTLKNNTARPLLVIDERSIILLLFTLTFVRGVAIGGLQVAGSAQLVILAVCDLIMLGCGIGLGIFPVASTLTLGAFVRICTVALMFTFVKGLAVLDKTRAIIGYIILSLHACVLILGFLCPALYKLVMIFVTKHRLPGQVLGIRDLRHRGTTSSRFETSDKSVASCSERQDQSTTDDSCLDALSLNDRYYRQPRKTAKSHSVKSRETSSATSHDQTPTPTSPCTDDAGMASEAAEAVVADSARNNAEPASTASSLEPRESDDCSPGKLSTSTVLGPRWDDFTFREADLYYRAARDNRASQTMRTFGSDGEESKGGFWSSSTWDRLFLPARRQEASGFTVIRR